MGVEETKEVEGHVSDVEETNTSGSQSMWRAQTTESFQTLYSHRESLSPTSPKHGKYGCTCVPKRTTSNTVPLGKDALNAMTQSIRSLSLSAADSDCSSCHGGRNRIQLSSIDASMFVNTPIDNSL